MKTYLTVRGEDGELRPQAALWPTGEKQKYFQPDIDKYMKKAEKEGFVLVEVEIVEIKTK